jgi:ABC-type Fe3+-hydroxamate transport system substrate-binding protein
VAAVEALEPELIVASADADRVDLARATRGSGAELYILATASIEDVERAALDLGFLIGEAVSARRVVGAIRRTVERVETQLAGLPRRSVFVDTGFFLTVTNRSLLGSLVERARGENVAAAQAGFGPFDLAELARLDPDVYLATSDSGVTLQELRRDPRTRELRAVRQGRFAVLPVRLVQPGPRIGDGFAAVAAALHPNAFR